MVSINNNPAPRARTALQDPTRKTPRKTRQAKTSPRYTHRQPRKTKRQRPLGPKIKSRNPKRGMASSCSQED